MKKVLIIVVAIVAIGVVGLSKPTTEQAHDTWQPEPMGTVIYGNDIL